MGRLKIKGVICKLTKRVPVKVERKVGGKASRAAQGLGRVQVETWSRLAFERGRNVMTAEETRE